MHNPHLAPHHSSREPFFAARRLLQILAIQLIALAPFAAAGKIDNTRNDQDTGVYDIAYVLPFTVEQPFIHNWRAKTAYFHQGTLAVLKVNRELVQPKNGLEPVLYAGDQTAQRLSQGDESGFVLALIPEQVDLSSIPVWFGAPELPERITADHIKKEKSILASKKVPPFDRGKITAVSRDSVTTKDLAELLREYAAELIMEFSPQEEHLVKSWRLPVAQR